MNTVAPHTADYYVDYARRVRCELCGATATRQIAGGRPGIRRTKIDCTMCSFQCYVETDLKTGENVRLEAKVVLDEVRRPEVLPLSIRQSSRAKAHAAQDARKLDVSELRRWYACGSPPDVDAWIAAGMPDKATWEALQRGETPEPPEPPTLAVAPVPPAAEAVPAIEIVADPRSRDQVIDVPAHPEPSAEPEPDDTVFENPPEPPTIEHGGHRRVYTRNPARTRQSAPTRLKDPRRVRQARRRQETHEAVDQLQHAAN